MVSRRFGEFRRMSVRLWRDDCGSTAPIFAITFSFVLLVVGIAVDFGISSHEKVRQQHALDAAALAASHKLGLPEQDELGEAAAQAYYRANSRDETRGTLESITLDAAAGEVRATAGGSVFTSVLAGFGIEKMSFGSGTRILKGKKSVEVAVVLDNSGSMSGDLETLKTAARNLTGIVYSGAEGDKVRMAIVPFAASVNVGAGHADADWIDGEALSPLHAEDFAAPANRFTLFSQLGIGWGGCVMARPYPHNVADTPADSGEAQTMFVPMFAPDEPDGNNDAGKSYQNSYLTDDAGACTPQPRTCTGGYSRRGKCQGWTTTPLEPVEAQTRLCKYQNQSRSGGSGPNWGCTSKPILPLTEVRQDVEDAIDAMAANGNTNIAEGTMWGWRVLSSAPPFTDGRAEDDEDNRKFLIIMTDGANFLSSADNQNKSVYAAYGYAAKNRLGTTYTQSAYTTALNANTSQACAAAKATGITIFTVAFRLENDTTTRNLLQGCSSGSGYALNASDQNGLVRAFEQIGREISQLRVAG